MSNDNFMVDMPNLGHIPLIVSETTSAPPVDAGPVDVVQHADAAPADAPAEAPVDEAATADKPKRRKTFRAGYKDEFIVRCTANRDPESWPVMLLTALKGCNVPMGYVDMAFGVPEDTVKRYLMSGANVVGADGDFLFTDRHAEQAFDMLYDLKMADAFTGNALDIGAVLGVMLQRLRTRA